MTATFNCTTEYRTEDIMMVQVCLLKVLKLNLHSFHFEIILKTGLWPRRRDVEISSICSSGGHLVHLSGIHMSHSGEMP